MLTADKQWKPQATIRSLRIPSTCQEEPAKAAPCGCWKRQWVRKLKKWSIFGTHKRNLWRTHNDLNCTASQTDGTSSFLESSRVTCVWDIWKMYRTVQWPFPHFTFICHPPLLVVRVFRRFRFVPDGVMTAPRDSLYEWIISVKVCQCTFK